MVFDMPSKRKKKEKWITSSSSPSTPPAKIAKTTADRPTLFKPAREQDRPFEWMLASNKRSVRVSHLEEMFKKICLYDSVHPCEVHAADNETYA